MPRCFLAAALLAGAVLWSGCDAADPAPDVASVVVSSNRTTVAVGETLALTATVRDAAGRTVDVPVTWRSENPAVATVTSRGEVRGVAEGQVTIVATAGGVSGRRDLTVVAAGTTLRTFNVATASACSAPDNRTFRRVAVSQFAEIWADVDNPPGGFTDAEYEELAREFDRVAWPTVVDAFGPPSDIDGNGRVLILYTRAVNELTEPGRDSFIGGFFFARDLFPRQSTPRLSACPASNEAEMFYMLVPDPQGVVNNNVRRKEDVRRGTVNTLVHELQHLVNASRRLFVNNAPGFEETWLDEGLSHIVEELAFYRESGLAPRQNLTIDDLRASQQRLDAANRHAVQNLARISLYLENPAAHTPFDVDDGLETRGAAWQFLRFVADQPGRNAEAFFRALGNAQSAGIDNLGAALGEPASALFRNWAVGKHLDDFLPGVPDRFRHRSWNFRSVLPALGRNEGRYPLAVTTLPDGAERTVSVRAGSAAHFRLVAASSAPVRLAVAPGGGADGGTCEGAETLSLAVGQVHEFDAAAPQVRCLAGPSGAEYAVVAFHNALPGAAAGTTRPPLANLVVALRADGVSTPPAGVAAARLFTEPRLDADVAVERRLDPARAWELRLRARERRELTPLIRGGTVAPPPAYARVQASSAPLQVTVARLR